MTRKLRTEDDIDAIVEKSKAVRAKLEREFHIAEINRVQAQRDAAERLLKILVGALIGDGGQPIEDAVELAQAIRHGQTCPTCKAAKP